MRVKSVFLAAASAAGLMIAGPVLAQTTTGGATNIDTDSDDNIQVNDVLDLFVVDNAPDSYSQTSTSTWSLSKSYSSSDNNVVATQYLKAINSNSQLDEVADFDGVDEDQSSVGYNSGNNSVNDNAFAAYAGILNNAWNTGLNANTQAATNIAAMGTVNFGAGGDTGSGNDPGDLILPGTGSFAIRSSTFWTVRGVGSMKRIFPVAIAIAIMTSATPVFAQRGANTEPDQPLPILLSETELAETRGGQTLIINNQTLKAITSGNVIDGDYVAGDISFSDNALSNFAGIGNFTVNTGAQNNLQTAMILTVNVTN